MEGAKVLQCLLPTATEPPLATARDSEWLLLSWGTGSSPTPATERRCRSFRTLNWGNSDLAESEEDEMKLIYRLESRRRVAELRLPLDRTSLPAVPLPLPATAPFPALAVGQTRRVLPGNRIRRGKVSDRINLN